MVRVNKHKSLILAPILIGAGLLMTPGWRLSRVLGILAGIFAVLAGSAAFLDAIRTLAPALVWIWVAVIFALSGFTLYVFLRRR